MSGITASEAEVRDACSAVEAASYEHAGLIRCVTIIPEFACDGACDIPNSRNPCRGVRGPGWHGRCGRRISWQVGVPGRGGVEWCCFTPIYKGPAPRWHPLSTITLHFATPPEHHEWLPRRSDCTLTGGECWTDSTSLDCDHGYDALVEAGSPAVWAWLAEAWLPDAVPTP